MSGCILRSLYAAFGRQQYSGVPLVHAQCPCRGIPKLQITLANAPVAAIAPDLLARPLIVCGNKSRTAISHQLGMHIKTKAFTCMLDNISKCHINESTCRHHTCVVHWCAGMLGVSQQPRHREHTNQSLRVVARSNYSLTTTYMVKGLCIQR